MKRFNLIAFSLVLPGLLFAAGCQTQPSEDAKSDAPTAEQKAVSVDVATAREGSLETNIEYVGTTFPVREVAVKSRIEGQIIELNVDIGDRVEQGQILGQIDDTLNTATVLEAEAELAALQSDVTSLQAEVNQGQTQVQQAKIILQQAQSDLDRANRLVKEGAVTQQSAEQAQNDLDNARQALESAQQQVANRSSAVVAAQKRVAAQEAIVAQERQRESFSTLISPVTGSVLARVLEPGDLAQVGDEILQLGDFSQIEVRVEISELELNKIRVGQTAQVRLDAFPQQTFSGEVTQISLAADATARLIPVEITIDNSDRRIGRGLLARVSFPDRNENAIVIPETAIEIANKTEEISNNNMATVFVIQEQDEATTVTARKVQLGDRDNSQVEILSGLQSGERYVVRSSGDLKEGDRVNLSFLSE